MNQKLNIYQVYFHEDQKSKLLEGCIPFFNSSTNERQLFETEVMFEIFNAENKIVDSELYGVLSWKFQEKTKLIFSDLLRFVQNSDEVDVYLMNPFPELVSLYENPWIQGEFVHPGLLSIAQRVFDESSYQVKLTNISLRSDQQVYCNYFLAKGEFWKNYIVFTKNLVGIVERNRSLNKAMKKTTSYNYAASFFPFFLERLLPTYLYLNPRIKSSVYPYTDEFLINRYLEVIGDKEKTLLRHQKIFRKIPMLSVIKKLFRY